MNSLLPSEKADLSALLTIAASGIHPVWQSDSRDVAWIESMCDAMPGSFLTVQAAGADWISFLRDRVKTLRVNVLILVNGLSSLAPDERPSANRTLREDLLNFGIPVLLVEPASQERQLREQFANVYAVTGMNFRREDSLLDDDHLWFNIAPTPIPLPSGSSGGIILRDGVAHHKASPVGVCQRCGKIPRLQQTQLIFQHAPDATRTQPVMGWVCECGNRYVHGKTAKLAHARAFGK